jgi:hypothetical protein
VDRLSGLKVAAVFGLWDVVMPAAGLLIGHGLAGELRIRSHNAADRAGGGDAADSPDRRPASYITIDPYQIGSPTELKQLQGAGGRARSRRHRARHQHQRG